MSQHSTRTVRVADPKEKQQPVKRYISDAVFHPTSCEYYSLCLRFKALLGLPGQLFARLFFMCTAILSNWCSNLNWFDFHALRLAVGRSEHHWLHKQVTLCRARLVLWYVTIFWRVRYLGVSTQFCFPLGLLNWVPALIGWGKGGNVTPARWQVR